MGGMVTVTHKVINEFEGKDISQRNCPGSWLQTLRL